VLDLLDEGARRRHDGRGRRAHAAPASQLESAQLGVVVEVDVDVLRRARGLLGQLRPRVRARRFRQQAAAAPRPQPARQHDVQLGGEQQDLIGEVDPGQQPIREEAVQADAC
jgi:hypothetical protein